MRTCDRILFTILQVKRTGINPCSGAYQTEPEEELSYLVCIIINHDFVAESLVKTKWKKRIWVCRWEWWVTGTASDARKVCLWGRIFIILRLLICRLSYSVGVCVCVIQVLLMLEGPGCVCHITGTRLPCEDTDLLPWCKPIKFEGKIYL